MRKWRLGVSAEPDLDGWVGVARVDQGRYGILSSMDICGHKLTKNSKPCSKPIGPAGWCGTKGHPRRAGAESASDASAAARRAALQAADAPSAKRGPETLVDHCKPHGCDLIITHDHAGRYFWGASHIEHRLLDSDGSDVLEGETVDAASAYREGTKAAKKLERRFRSQKRAPTGDGKETIHGTVAQLAEQGRSF